MAVHFALARFRPWSEREVVEGSKTSGPCVVWVWHLCPGTWPNMHTCLPSSSSPCSIYFGLSSSHRKMMVHDLWCLSGQTMATTNFLPFAALLHFVNPIFSLLKDSHSSIVFAVEPAHPGHTLPPSPPPFSRPSFTPARNFTRLSFLCITILHNRFSSHPSTFCYTNWQLFIHSCSVSCTRVLQFSLQKQTRAKISIMAVYKLIKS